MILTAIQGIIPLLTGFAGGILKLHLENKAEQHKILVERAVLKEKSRERAANLKDSGVSWTRRTIALLFVMGLLSIIALVLFVGFVSPDIAINVPVEVQKDSILSFLGITDPKIVTDYKQLNGLAIVMPLIEPVVSAVQVIVGFYFGSAKSK